jgi:hypothetical protein
VLSVNDKKFSVSLSMYFGVHWTEDRLKLPQEGSNFTAANWLPIDLDFMKNLWIPNVFVYNLNSFTALDCLKKLAGLWIVKDRDFFYNQVSEKEASNNIILLKTFFFSIFFYRAKFLRFFAGLSHAIKFP